VAEDVPETKPATVVSGREKRSTSQVSQAASRWAAMGEVTAMAPGHVVNSMIPGTAETVWILELGTKALSEGGLLRSVNIDIALGLWYLPSNLVSLSFVKLGMTQ